MNKLAFQIESDKSYREMKFSSRYDNKFNDIKGAEKPYFDLIKQDKSKLIFSNTFRKLSGKTQVILSTHSSLARTRLTHTMEVVELSKKIAYQLGLNIDLVETQAIGHDFGHTPFGHIGERTLDKISSTYKLLPFKHNMNSLRIIRNYEDKSGLNITYPVMDGILKHTKLYKNEPQREVFFKPENKIGLTKFHKHTGYDYPINHFIPFTLEGQVVNLADEIIQRATDLEDGIRERFVSLYELLVIPEIKKIHDFFGRKEKTDTKIKNIKDNPNRIITYFTRDIINYYMYDVVETSLKNIAKSKAESYSDIVLKNPKPKFLIQHSKSLLNLDKKLDKMIKEEFVMSPEVATMDKRAEYLIQKVFERYQKYTEQLPKPVQLKIGKIGSAEQIIVDYISMMTDEQVHREYNRFYNPPQYFH